ncbi:flagellar assembly protein FliH [Neiella marina]|uniref:Flagellar assembly protein FliH n=1 Tax=Neiella holothuriorum TaxID=2870530 RepID=A0ABS7EEM8_9GAMM|nr:flagellar assembly protein FliH [Neiella holothuriorum]MBW8190804.1 flagellar assembly protein FliH [Neiella holothuriorum]
MTNPEDHKVVTPSNETEAELMARWNLPDVTVEQEDVGNAMNLTLGAETADVEQEDVVDEAPMLTAEALEEIRAAAREEGFAEGKQEGFIKGHQQGVESGHAEGLEKGIQEGHQQGLATGQAEVDERLQQFDALMRGLHVPQQQIDQLVERELVQLVTAVAQAVTRHELTSDPALILNTLKQAADLLPFQQQRVRVQLHPEDMEQVQRSYSDEQIQQRGWLLEPEAGLNRGDVRMLTEHSDVTIDMEQRLAKVSDIFLAQLNNLSDIESPALTINEPTAQEPEAQEAEPDTASPESSNDPEPTS